MRQSFLPLIALLEYTLHQTFTNDNIFACGNVAAAATRFATYTQQLCASEVLFEESRLPLVMSFVLFTALSREQTCDCISSETIGVILRPHALSLFFHSWLDSICQFLLSKSKTQRISIHLQLFELVYITDFSGIVVEEFQISNFCVLKVEKPDKDCFLCLISALANSTSFNALFT